MGHRKVVYYLLTTIGVLVVSACADPARNGVPTSPSGLTSATTNILENAPFEGHDAGTFEFLENGCAVGLTALKTHTTGTATLIGSNAFDTQECFDDTALTFTGSLTITAANGDTLVGTLTGQVTGFLNDVTPMYAFSADITGGTGRFAGARGTISGTGQGNLGTFAEARSYSGTLSGVPRGES
jgi:hypothetical protein